MIKNKGYTLIEVLVSMVIFSVLITLAVSSYRYFFSATASKNTNTVRLSALSQHKVINTSIRSLEPYYYRDVNNEAKLFFKGQEKTLSFVSYSPSYLNEPLVIANLFISRDGRELRYCEQPLGSRSLVDYKFTAQDCPESKLYLQAENINFSYYSWKDAFEFLDYYSEYLNIAVKPSPQWRDFYDGAVTLTLPLFIRIASTGHDGVLPASFMFEVAPELPLAKRDKSGASG